jgi:hypothetical protein
MGIEMECRKSCNRRSGADHRRPEGVILCAFEILLDDGHCSWRKINFVANSKKDDINVGIGYKPSEKERR